MFFYWDNLFSMARTGYFLFIEKQDESNSNTGKQNMNQKTGIIIITNDPETCWVAIRYAGFYLMEQKNVKIFFVDSGVKYSDLSHKSFNIRDTAGKFLAAGGTIEVCEGREMLKAGLQKYFDSLLSTDEIMNICDDKFQSLMTKKVYVREFKRIV